MKFIMRPGIALLVAAVQGRFWEMHDRLFANQQALTPDNLLTHAQALGLDARKFAACFAGQAAARVRADMALGSEAGVTATPSFFLGTTSPGGRIKVTRKLNGAVPFTTFKAAIDAMLASAPPAE